MCRNNEGTNVTQPKSHRGPHHLPSALDYLVLFRHQRNNAVGRDASRHLALANVLDTLPASTGCRSRRNNSSREKRQALTHHRHILRLVIRLPLVQEAKVVIDHLKVYRRSPR